LARRDRTLTWGSLSLSLSVSLATSLFAGQIKCATSSIFRCAPRPRRQKDSSMELDHIEHKLDPISRATLPFDARL